jgi:hypothetical protein
MPGEYSYGLVVVAMLLCLITIGFILVLWMLLARPDGTLIVNYQLSPNAPDPPKSPLIDEDLVPQDGPPVPPGNTSRFCGVVPFVSGNNRIWTSTPGSAMVDSIP